MTNRDTVVAVFTDVARGQNRKLAPLTDDALLLELGLDLCDGTFDLGWEGR